MLGMSKLKNSDAVRFKTSMQEIREQLDKCKHIGRDCDVDLDKYDLLLEEMKAKVSGNVAIAEDGEEVNIVKEREALLSKESQLMDLSKKILNCEAEYQIFINETKEELEKSDIELSRIKVRVKRKMAEMNSISIEDEVSGIPDFIENAKSVLDTIRKKKEAKAALDEVKELPVELFESTRKMTEEDERKIYAVRKTIHTAREILTFMEFRFKEIERTYEKGVDPELAEEWNKVQSEKQACERYVNEQNLIAKRATDRLLEVRSEIAKMETPIDEPVEEVDIEAKLQEAIDYMTEKADELQVATKHFMENKDNWNQELSMIEMKLEEMWRNI